MGVVDLKSKSEDVSFVQVRNGFCVYLLVGAEDGRVEVVGCMVTIAVVVELEMSKAPRGEEFRIDDVTEL